MSSCQIKRSPNESLIWLFVVYVVLQFPTVEAAQIVIDGPPGSRVFGENIAVLPNGNIVVTDREYVAPGPLPHAGAVYLYAPDGTLISKLMGSAAWHEVGIAVTVLSNGDFVVRSPFWDNGSVTAVGAVTYVSGETGIDGVVSAENSLVGSNEGDFVGSDKVVELANGKVVVVSSLWDNGAAINAGAVTFASDSGGLRGEISSTNSLLGSGTNDRVGGSGIVALESGNYVVQSEFWGSGKGAATFGLGSVGVHGEVSPANSLVGTNIGDQIGASVVALDGGAYVVRSPQWDNGSNQDAGAVTFGPANVGAVGVITATNSLIGGAANDFIGSNGVTALASGNYVVVSPSWDNLGMVDVGAATFGSGSQGVSGLVSTANSLIGSAAFNLVGSGGVFALTNGNYVVCSPHWDNGAVFNVGAATLGFGQNGAVGAVSMANSLVGSTGDDNVCLGGIYSLANGNFVVSSFNWTNGGIQLAGAATLMPGGFQLARVVSAGNSLVGSSTGDQVSKNTNTFSVAGAPGVVALPNGNYVVRSEYWDDGSVSNAGAVSWGDGGSAGATGHITALNSLVGTRQGDAIGSGGVTALTNGGYAVSSPIWDNGAVIDVGAVTYGGPLGVTGQVSAGNSVIGTAAEDLVGRNGVKELPGVRLLIMSPFWRNAAAGRTGAVTNLSALSAVGSVSQFNSLIGAHANEMFGDGIVAVQSSGHYVVHSPGATAGAMAGVGTITLGMSSGNVNGAASTSNSVFGVVEGGGAGLLHAYDADRHQLIVGDRSANRVVLFRVGADTNASMVSDVPDPSTAGQVVVFTAHVSSDVGTPTSGRTRFFASSGESCIDIAGVDVGANVAEYSCGFALNGAGTTLVRAEYLGSDEFAYSRSPQITHATTADVIFASSFD